MCSKLYQEIHDKEVELAKIKIQIAYHNIQNPQVEVESNFNVLSTIDESNLNFLPPHSNKVELQWPSHTG